MSDIETITTNLIAQAESDFASCDTIDQLMQSKALYLGKEGQINKLLKQILILGKSVLKTQGHLINKSREHIEKLLAERSNQLEQLQLKRQLQAEQLDITKNGRSRGKGSIHPINLVVQRLEDIFQSMGFAIADGPEIETDWFNFETLNIAKNHPARSMHDTFYLEGGNLLRTHTSPMQVRYALRILESIQHSLTNSSFENLIGGIRVIAPGKTYRVDSDATHSPMFHQCEGLWLDTDISFSNLKAVLTDFYQTFFDDKNLVMRFRPSFFPFTEPSAEVDISFSSHSSEPQWIEIAGCGQVHPQVIKNMGLDPEKISGFAFGMGIDRLTMLAYKISDLRTFFQGDLRFLKQFIQ